MSTIQIRIPNWLDLIFACPLLAYRLLRVGCAYRRIYLDEGKWTILDPDDYYLFARFKWCIGGYKNKYYAVRSQIIGPEDIRIVRLHRLIMNAPDGVLVDHVNGDSLDNRKCNLRLATRSQNQYNKRKAKNTSSRFKGVYFRKNRGMWIAYIVAGKKIWLGSFYSEIEAARAHDQAAVKHHGEFARLNFPEENSLSAARCP